MQWGKLTGSFNRMVWPSKEGRYEALSEMVAGERPFDAETLKKYATKGVWAGVRTPQILQMAIEHNVNDAARTLIDQKKVDLDATPIVYRSVKKGDKAGVANAARAVGDPDFSRAPTYGEFMLKTAVDSGNVAMIRKLHAEKVPADLRAGYGLYVFERASVDPNVVSALRELYPAESAKALPLPKAAAKPLVT